MLNKKIVCNLFVKFSQWYWVFLCIIKMNCFMCRSVHITRHVLTVPEHYEDGAFQPDNGLFHSIYFLTLQELC